MEYSDEKEVVVGGSHMSLRSSSTLCPARDSDKEVSPITPTVEKFAVVDNSHDAPQLDQRHDISLEVATPVDENAGDDAKNIKASRTALCGMPRRTAYWVFAVAGLLAIAAIIAASVATTVGKRDTSNVTAAQPTSTEPETPTTTYLATDVSASSVSSDGVSSDVGNYTCPESNGTSYNTSYFNTANYGTFYFLELCNIDWPAGSATNDPNTPVQDLSIVLADSLEQCMNQCALYSVQNNLACMAVTYEANKTLASERDGVGGNCWLKNKPGQENVYLADDANSKLQAAFVNMMTG